jgi:hypothetical protein
VYATIIKTAVWVLIIVEAWLLIQVPAVGDAIFSFVVGGEVPGTDRILSPTEMMFFLAGFFVLAVGLFFHREISFLFSRAPKEQQPAEAVAAPSKAAAIRADKPKKIARPKRKLPDMGPAIRFAAAALVRLRTIGMQRVRVGSAKAQNEMIRGAIAASRALRRGWTSFALQSIAFWLWVCPYIERFDRWLSRKIHENSQTASLLAFANEMTKTVKSWFQYVRTFKDRYLSF